MGSLRESLKVIIACCHLYSKTFFHIHTVIVVVNDLDNPNI
jgi:hypothetical protein